jgi:flagella basal body P-ring formation protein FlgA
LKLRQWFAAGDTVRVVTVGSGFAISADGQALAPGIEGQTVKVRIEGGRVVSGRATAERRIEVTL